VPRPRTPTVRLQLHPAQAAFRHSDATYRGFVGGVGSGKSFAGAYDLLRRARPGRLYLACAPTYPMLRDASLRTFLALAERLLFLRDFHRSDMVATLGNRSEVLFRSADDPDRLRGPNLSGAWCDEASLVAREAFDVLIGRLREAGEQGWLAATFTPKGRQHWTFDRFGRGHPDTALFHARTADNPFLPPGFEARLRQQYHGLLADQELGGLFVSVEGAEWPASYFPDSLWFGDWPEGLLARAAALDPSKGKDARSGDYAAFALLAVDSDGVLWCEADLYRGRSAEYLAEAAVAHQRSFRPDVLAVESNQFLQLFAVIIDQVARRRGVLVPVVELHNSAPKPVRIRRLGPYLAQGRFRFRDTPGTRLLVDQLREFPEGQFDDGPDSLEMALRVLADLLAERDQGREGPTVLRT
jgi:predicted phage terminase large subunit-like protein